VTVVDLAALPLARAVVDRAADLRTDPDVVARARRDPATLVLVVGGSEVVLGESGTVAFLDPATAARVAGDDERDAAAQDGLPASGSPDDEGSRSPLDDDAWLLLGRDGEDESAPLVLARRVRRGKGAPRIGQPSDVLVHGPVEEPETAELVVPAGVARTAAAHDPVPAPGLRWAALREAGADLPARDAGLATTAVALDEWHTRHPRCPRCGAPTVPAQAGWIRVCTAEGSEHYPRTDPAIIVAVVDDEDRILLGHNAAWPKGRFSTLAGFVEAGESAEHAVTREVGEETAIVVDRVDYRGSQPWPFPASLMLAYRGHAATTDVTVDGHEVTEARWFTRDELKAAVTGGDVLLPMRTSVAYALITDWFGGPLPTRW
jgi:NAD+ diphosphatase